MATGTPVSEFLKFVGDKKPPYSDLDCAQYLLECGYGMGIGFSNLDGSYVFHPGATLQMNYLLETYPAYVVVKSCRFPGMPHAVYWDGEKVLDSNPNVEADGLPLEEYEILYWLPIYKVGGVFEEQIKEVMEKAK